MPAMYSLTHLTGSRRNEHRRSVVLTFEVRQYAMWVFWISLGASAIPTLLFALILGPYAVVIPVVCVIAGFILWDTRQRNGMRLRTYQAILDRRRARKRARNGTVYAAGRPIPKAQLVMHMPVTIPVRDTADAAPVMVSGVRRRRSSTRKGFLTA